MRTINPEDLNDLLEVLLIALSLEIMDKKETIDLVDCLIHKHHYSNDIFNLIIAHRDKSKSEIISFIDSNSYETDGQISSRVVFSILHTKLLTGQLSLNRILEIIESLFKHSALTEDEGIVIRKIFTAIEKDAKLNLTMQFLELYKVFKLNNPSEWTDVNKNFRFIIHLFWKIIRNKEI